MGTKKWPILVLCAVLALFLVQSVSAVVTLYPDANDTPQEWNTNGCSSHLDCLTDANEATYIVRGVDEKYDFFNFEDLPQEAPDTITGVDVWVKAKYWTASDYLYKIVLEINNQTPSFIYYSPIQQTASYWGWDHYCWPAIPDSNGPFSRNHIDTLDIGVLTTDGGDPNGAYGGARVDRIEIDVLGPGESC